MAKGGMYEELGEKARRNEIARKTKTQACE
jgi:hypothetical protein